jgi:tetratricopeptide (TPR) repeat protein
MVKNEEKVIGRCLESVKDIADLFIISDTGCIDNTVEIIKSFCKINKKEYQIYRNEWINFGHNRNELLKITRNQSGYSLLLDADMTIDLQNFNKEKLSADAYYIRYSGDLDFAQILLINNKFNWNYFGVTHEYINSNEAKIFENLDSIKINHLYDGSNRINKANRDIKLLEQGIIDEPNNSRYYFYLANSYRDSGNYKKALDLYEQRIFLGGWDQEIFYSYYQMGICSEKLNANEVAKKCYLNAFELRPTRSEPLYRLSVLCRNLGQYQQAYMYSKRGLDVSYPEDVIFIEKPVYDYLLLFEKSIAAYYIGKHQESYNDCKKLLSIKNISDSIKIQTEKNIKFSEEKINKIN